MIWGNDEKYTKEFQIKCREEQQKKYNELMNRLAKEKEEKERQVINSALRKHEENANAREEITDVFIKQHLEAKIIAARWALGIGMAMTLLFKGQWLFWIVFIIIYLLYVKNIKAEALKVDKNRKDLGKKR